MIANPPRQMSVSLRRHSEAGERSPKAMRQNACRYANTYRGTDRPHLTGLQEGRPPTKLDAMKTLTTREFFHAPGLVKSLRPGQSLVVTDKGMPAFTVTKAGKRSVKTAGDLRREAKEIFPEERPKVNLTQILKQLKK